MSAGARLVDLVQSRIDEFLDGRTPILASIADDTAPFERFSRDFLAAMGLGPFAVQAALALALDLKLRSMYGSQLWTFTGVLILFSLALRPEAVGWRRAVIGCGFMGVGMVVAAIVYDQAWPYVNGQPMSVHFPGREAAARVHAVWRERFDQPLLVVGGEWMLAANAALYSRPRLQVYGGGPYARDPAPSPRDNPWTSDEALKRTGGILLWSADRQEPSITCTCAGASRCSRSSIPWRSAGRRARPSRPCAWGWG